jgi:RHS repeat-associated protein
MVADSTGTTVWRWDQTEPFGANPANEDPDANSVVFDLPLRLPGQRYDKETGLHYNMARNYSPDGGRYVEADPVGLLTTGRPTPTTTLNQLYAYAKSSPVLFADPSGLRPYDFQIGYGGGVGHIIVGGSVYTATIKDAQTGQTCSYQIRCVGLGVGLPEAGVTSKPARFDDGQPCSTCEDFTGLGYMGGASGQVGGGPTIGGGVKIPNGPFITNDILGLDYGAFRIGVSHNVCYFSLQ